MKKIILLGLGLLAGMFCFTGCIGLQNNVKSDELRLQTENSNLIAKNTYLSNDLVEQQGRVTSLQDQRDALMKSLMQLSNDDHRMKNALDSTRAQLGTQIEDLKKAIATKDQAIEDLNVKISRLIATNVLLPKSKVEEMSNMARTQRDFVKAMQEELDSQDMKIRQLGDILKIDFVDKIFFDSGSATIRNSGKKVLDKLVTVLKNIQNKQIRIEGYTDDVPINKNYTWRYPSNWELSTARSTSIVRYLQSKGINPHFMKATGYGEYNPIASNDTEAGRQQNRRIAILLVPLDTRSEYK